MPLKVVLRPGEKLLVNGAVLGAGERSTTLFVHNQAQFLRGRDLLSPAEATCALRHLYLAIQQLYLAAPEAREAAEETFAQQLQAAREAHADHEAAILAVAAQVAEGAFYPAMRALAKIFRPAS